MGEKPGLCRLTQGDFCETWENGCPAGSQLDDSPTWHHGSPLWLKAAFQVKENTDAMGWKLTQEIELEISEAIWARGPIISRWAV